MIILLRVQGRTLCVSA